MQNRFVVAALAVVIGAGAAVAQTGGGSSSGGASGGAGTLTGSTGSGAASGTATSAPSATASRTTVAPGTGTTAQPGPPPDATGTRGRLLTAPADSQAGTLRTQQSPTISTDGRALSTDSAASGRGEGASAGDEVVPPTAMECSRGWHAGSRWSQSQLTQLCNR